MKRLITTLLSFLLIAGALLAALTPVAFRQYRLWQDARIAAEYLSAAEAMSPADAAAMLAAARSYDAARGAARWSDPFGEAGGTEDPPDAAYPALLDPAGNGVMAVLEIPKLGATLPVYHGVRGAALGAGTGHLPGSGLPVGESGEPCVLAARRGGWYAGPFSGLDRLIPGDCFTLRVLRDARLYRVFRVTEAEPEALAAREAGGGDTCILMTTTPRGVDTRRLLVWGERVSRQSAQPADDTQPLPDWAAGLVLAAPVLAAGLAVLVIVETLRRGAQRRRRRRMRL